MTVPEKIKRIAAGQGIKRRMPDVIADYLGVRLVIEGRSDEGANVGESLANGARRRVVEGITPICIAVLYPAESLEELKKRLSNAILTVRVFNQASEGYWTDASLDELSAIIRRSYDDIVKEDIVTQTVTGLNDRISYFNRVRGGESKSTKVTMCTWRCNSPTNANERVERDAFLGLANAMNFQEVLAANDVRVRRP